MVAPLTQKNSLVKTGFRLTASGFAYRGREYADSDVVSIRSYRVIHQTNYVLVAKVQHDPAISFVLTLKDGTQAQVTEQSTWTSSSDLNRVHEIQTALDTLCKRTFEQRARKYTSQIQTSGFFQYGTWLFFPQEKRFMDTSTGKSFSTASTNLLLHYGFIEVQDRNEGFAAKLLRRTKEEALGGRYGIPTAEDGDVFFSLLGHYLAIRW